MNTISAWLLSIAGMIILSVLTEFVLPDGQINKYVKMVFSFIILLVIIMPIPKLLKKEFDITKYVNEDINLQDNYLEQINLNKITTISTEISEKIAGFGLKNVEIAINSNIFSEKLEIYGISVDLRNLKYDEKIENKNIKSAKEIILKIINQYTELTGVEVKFYE